MTKTETVDLLRKMSEDERIKAYVWEAIEETFKVMSLADVPTAVEYAHGKSEHLRYMSVSHSAYADKMDEI